MLSESNKGDGEEGIEQLLASFSPAPASIDRDQLMFAAGMRAAQAAAPEPASALRSRLWPALALVSTAAAVILGVIAWQRPERIVIVERQAAEQQFVKQTAPAAPSEAIVITEALPKRVPTFDPALNYVHRRDLIVRDGAEALPTQDTGDAYVARIAPTQRELLKELPGGLRQQYQVDSEAWWQAWLISGDRL